MKSLRILIVALGAILLGAALNQLTGATLIDPLSPAALSEQLPLADLK